MSLEQHLHHKAEVWRPTQSAGEYGEVRDTFTRVTNPTSNNAEPYVLDHHLDDPGPGEKLSGRRKWTLRKDATVRSRDVLRITAGLHAPSRWLVLSCFNAGRRGVLHHYELETEPYDGLLPPDEPADEESS